jgi:hypothetical protein
MNIINWINYERLTLQEYYPALTITNLLKMLQEPQRQIPHKEIINALYQILNSLNDRTQYLGQVNSTC